MKLPKINKDVLKFRLRLWAMTTIYFTIGGIAGALLIYIVEGGDGNKSWWGFSIFSIGGFLYGFYLFLGGKH